METLEQIQARIRAAVPEAQVEIVPNGSPGNQPSLWLGSAQALAVVTFLRDDPQLRLDYASNVTGVDWPDLTTKEKIRVKRVFKEQEIEVDEIRETVRPGFLEAVYHLYSMELKHGPLIIRLRTPDRLQQVHVPSLTPIYRGAEFQEREIYDLFGIRFDGHPDLRRLLMWDEFEDHPMRKDYREPDDYEYEPTPHGEVLDKARLHYPPEAAHG